MPYHTAKFADSPGFAVRYNTSDAAVMGEWHEMLVSLLRKGLFTFLCDGVRSVTFLIPTTRSIWSSL